MSKSMAKEWKVVGGNEHEHGQEWKVVGENEQEHGQRVEGGRWE